MVKAGYAADLIGINLDKIWYDGAQADPPAAIVLCHTDNVDLSIVNGQVVIEKGRLIKIDLDELVSRHNQNSAKLYKRAL